MKITSYRVRAVRVPYEQAITGTHVILQLQTDDGIEGLGYVSRLQPAIVGPLIAVLEGYLEQVVGQEALNIEAVNARLFRRGGGLPGFEARAASLIDVALWDIKAKAAGQPVWQLMGGYRDRVPCYASWRIEPGLDDVALAESAVSLCKQGFKAMKFHTGAMARQATLNHMRVLREAVGPDIDIMVDVNQRWNVKQAVEMSRALAPYAPYWIEDPVPLDDYEGLRQVKEASEVRICAGEVYRSIVPFRHLLANRSVDIAMIDLDIGMSGFLKVAHAAEAFDIPVVNHLATEIMAHGIAAVPNGLTVEFYPWAQELFLDPPHLVEGELVLSHAPGYGLELDEGAMQRLELK